MSQAPVKKKHKNKRKRESGGNGILQETPGVYFCLLIIDRSDVKKVQLGNNQEMAQSERNSHSSNPV